MPPGFPHEAVKYPHDRWVPIRNFGAATLDSETYSVTLGFLLESELVKIPQKTHWQFQVSRFETVYVGVKETRLRDHYHSHWTQEFRGVFTVKFRGGNRALRQA